MHILLMPSWYFPHGSQEIQGRMVLHLAQGLRQRGFDARILYTDYHFKGPFIRKVTWQTEEYVPTMRISGFLPPKRNKGIMTWWLRRCKRDVREYIALHGRPDVIHAHSYFAASVCAALSDEFRIPFIYTERLSSFVSAKIPSCHLPFLQTCFDKADMLTCVSPGLRKALHRFSNREISVIPNFVDETIFHPGMNELKNEVFTWVSVGEPASVKGLDLLIHAFSLLKTKVPETEMQLILVDRIAEQQELQHLAAELNVGQHIQWPGLITQQQLATLYRSSHVMVSASRIETFGKAIIEALACGLPVVATKTDGAIYIVDKKELGELTETENAQMLATAMYHVMYHYDQYDPNTLSSAISARFGKEVILSQWIAQYKSVTA